MRAYNNAHELRSWYDTSKSAKGYMPRWAYAGGLWKAAEIGDLTLAQKAAIRQEAIRWAASKPKGLFGDLVVAGKGMVGSMS